MKQYLRAVSVGAFYLNGDNCFLVMLSYCLRCFFCMVEGNMLGRQMLLYYFSV